MEKQCGRSEHDNKQNENDMEEDWDREDFQNDYHNSENGKDDCYDWDEQKFDDNILRRPNQKDIWRKRYTLERDDNKNLIMTVSSNRIGQIIGKQGVKIKELEQNSGAKIIIGEPCIDDPSLTEIILIGSDDSQRECQRMINDWIGAQTASSQTANGTEIYHVQKKEEDDAIFIDWDAVNEKAEKVEKERWADVPPLKKNFYVEHPDVQKMSQKEVEEFRENYNNIVVQIPFGDGDGEILNPVTTFEQAFSLYPEIMREIKKTGFEKPSPIQCQAWPVLLSGKDLIGIAQTGTGKTLAFLLPALIHIDGQEVPRSERKGPNVLVLAPTRELALQIQKEVQKYSYRDIKCVCVYGGGNRQQQVDLITQGVEIIIATPGRLNDLIETGVINITSITYLVLDEADRMLDMGFEPQIRKVLLDIRPDRQSVMTSATWNGNVHRLAEKYMISPVQIYVGSLDLAAVHSVTQRVWIVEEDKKNDYLFQFIKSLSDDDKVIVFVGKKKIADFLSCELAMKNIPCQCIHGDRDQMDREQAIEDVKTGEVNILIATDVASRGLDIIDITKVFNYDFPKNIEEYVHRVGRTGRAGRTGEAVTLFTRSDWAYAEELIKIMTQAKQDVPNELYCMRDRFLKYQEKRNGERRYLDERGGGGGGGRYSGEGEGGDYRGGGGRYSGEREGGDYRGGGGGRYSGEREGGDYRGGGGRYSGEREGGDYRGGGGRYSGEREGGDYRGGGRYSGERERGDYRGGGGGRYSGEREGGDYRGEKAGRGYSDERTGGRYGHGKFGGRYSGGRSEKFRGYNKRY